MEVGHVVFGGRAALDEVQVRALIHDDEGMLKLACAGGVQAEVGLQRNLHMHARRDVDEGAAAPNSAVQGRELMIGGRHQLHEMLAHHLGIGAGEGAFHIGVHNALGGYFSLDVVVNHLGVILSTDTGQAGALGLGDAQTLKGVLDVVGHFAPLAAHLGIGAHVGDNVAHVQAGDGGAPVLHRHLVVGFQCFQAEDAHPFRVVLFLTDLFHDLRRQAGADLERRVGRIFDVVNAAVYFGDVGLFSLKGSHLASSSFRAAKPSSMISLTSSPLPVRTMRASSSTWT